MKSPILIAAILIPLALFPQHHIDRPPDDAEKPGELRLPNGKLQRDEILKADHEKCVKEAAQLIDLAESLKQDLEKDNAHVLSISTLKKTEEIEKLAKRIRARLKHF
jgi:hypothetical protein